MWNNLLCIASPAGLYSFAYEGTSLQLFIIFCHILSLDQLLLKTSSPDWRPSGNSETDGHQDKNAEGRTARQHVECVCYGLGTFSSCVSARYQLAMLLLLLDAGRVRESASSFVMSNILDPVFDFSIYTFPFVDSPEGLLCLRSCILLCRKGRIKRARFDRTHRKWGKLLTADVFWSFRFVIQC